MLQAPADFLAGTVHREDGGLFAQEYLQMAALRGFKRAALLFEPSFGPPANSLSASKLSRRFWGGSGLPTARSNLVEQDHGYQVPSCRHARGQIRTTRRGWVLRFHSGLCRGLGRRRLLGGRPGRTRGRAREM